jgi:copper(I)-binding protein
MSSKLLAVAASLLIAGSAAAQTGQVEVKNAWARATPGKAENGAAYLTIVSPTPDRLTAISTPEAKTAELHTMTMEGGVMKMRPLAGVDLPAGQPVTLKPGGSHIMLMGLTQPLKQGDTFPLTLSFDKAGTKQVTVAVEGPGAMAPQTGSTGNTPMGSMPAKH